MGFTLMEKFDTPYFARSIKDFWRRWHISLSSWFRDYLYIPLGGNRRGRVRKYWNLMVTFAASGFWHGAGWNYVIWGLLHGAYQVVGDCLMPVRQWFCKVCRVRTQSFSHKLLQTITTFLLVTFAWIFFRARSLRMAAGYIFRMMTEWTFETLAQGGLLRLGLGYPEWNILLVSVLILFLVGLVRYRQQLSVDAFLSGQSLWFRWGVLYLLFFMILIFGKYGPEYSQQAFIYFQF